MKGINNTVVKDNILCKRGYELEQFAIEGFTKKEDVVDDRTFDLSSF